MTGAGVLTGLLSVVVLFLVNHALHQHEKVSALFILAFVVVALGKIVANVANQLLSVHFSQTTILELSLALCAKILNAPLRLIERRGGANILATLTDDVSSVTWAVQSLPQLAMNGAVVIGCSLYLAWLSWPMFASVIGVTLLGVLIYKLLYTRAFRRIYAARDARSRLFGHFRDLTTGTKELMMHRARRESFLEQEIRSAADDYRENNIVATTHYALAEAWLQTLYHGLMALVLFVLPLFAKPTPEALTGYVFTMLYMMAPLWSIVEAFPAVARGQVALAKIEELGVSMGETVLPTETTHGIAHAIGSTRNANPSASIPAPASNGQNNKSVVHGSVIEMNQVMFTYDGAEGAPANTSSDTSTSSETTDQAFSLGPVNFRLAPGELVFVVGGNGSGKSTFVKVLTGLYAPHQGQLLIGGTPITDATREWYREHFSVVFADCFIFSKLLGLTAPDLDATTRQYLQLLQIDHKVSLHTGPEGSAFSTVDLSTGQRKRLALVTAYLEDRPFYVFDEWAADQDPEYKKIFYSKLLPDLRNRGKAVVVITHDDRYFHMGDRVIKLEDGKVTTWDELQAQQYV
jgi:putative ATP-binding cassette transporter